MIRPRLGILASLALLASLSPALAHALLDHSLPAVGSTIHKSPAQVEFWFTAEIEPHFSSVRVLDSNGHNVDRGDAAVNAGDKKALTVSVRPLSRGKYKVVWQVVSTDSHKTAGSFSFTVAP
jgi:copper resistance protein C